MGQLFLAISLSLSLSLFLSFSLSHTHPSYRLTLKHDICCDHFLRAKKIEKGEALLSLSSFLAELNFLGISLV
jgi:hypothetical protein